MNLRACAALATAMLGLWGTGSVYADPAPFDLAGPQLAVSVTRGATKLPIAEVPNLAAGDRLAIKAEFPPSQSAHYVMVAAFLRGSTNPPPNEWFHRCDTWSLPCSRDGITVTVPPDAEQVLVFLAPATGGDFRTLVNAVRGRPGAFVRASQALNQAALDRSRLDAYLGAIRSLDEGDRSRLRDAAPLLARSLAIKVDEKCLDRLPELQAPCLAQGQDSLILNDGHSTSIVEALTSGPAADLAMEASYSSQLSYGYYSPYVASILDIARIMSSINTAHFQYIPALASPRGQQLALTLNTPPSFHDPKSVLVAALPAVEPPQTPPLHAVDAKGLYCARKTALVLPVEGAPLVFSTQYAHDLRLHLTGAGGRTLDLPAQADAERGGFVVDTTAVGKMDLGDSLQGSLHGTWGFEDYSGPTFRLVNLGLQPWEVAQNDPQALIVGREDTVHLHAAGANCLADLVLKDTAGKELKPVWKAVDADDVEVKLPLEAVKPGPLTLLVHQYGVDRSATVPLQAFADAGHIEGFILHAGDDRGLLKGTRLDEVASLVLRGVEFTPDALTAGNSGDELTMIAAASPPLPVLKPRDVLRAHVRLKDGRNIDVDATIAQPRPSVALIDHSIEAAPASDASHIQLGERGELPQGAKLSFSVRARSPATFAHDEKIEVATVDEAFSTMLSVGAGITLEDRHVAVARFDPAAAFGPSAFGPLQFRVIEDGAAGDWQPLTTLVRLPVLKALECPSTPELACRLSGTDLFLVDAVSDDRRFSHPVRVPDGFPGRSLPVPHPIDGQLYLKLRDDPAVVHLATLVAEPRPASPEEAEHAPERQASTTPAVAAADSLAPPTVTSAAAAAAPLPVVAAAAAAVPATPTDRSAAPLATTSPALPPAGAVPPAAAVQPSAAVQPAAVVIATPTPSSKAPAVVTTVAAPVSATGPSPALSPAPLAAPSPAGE